MRVLVDRRYADRSANVLVVMLPGAMQQPEEFLHAGFASAVRARNLSVDLVMVDCEMQFIGDSIDGSLLAQLHEIVSGAAHGQHYREIWIGGISIGGLIATSYVNCYPDTVNGLCLLAPYPGNRILLADIAAASGLDHWHANDNANDAEHRMWQWLQRHRQQAQIGALYFGYGDKDRFAQGHRMMAQALDTRHVDIIDGAHDWTTWQTLWCNFIARFASEATALTAEDSA